MARDTQTRRKDTRDIVRGALINLAGTVVRSLKFILFIVLGRLYGPEGVGLFLLALATADLFSNIGIMGLDQTVLTLAARRHADGDTDGLYRTIGQALAIGSALSFGITILIELLAPWFSSVFFDKPELTLPLRIISLAIPFWTLSAILLYATRALRVMQYEIIVKSAVEPAVMLLLAVSFYFSDFGPTGMYLAVLFAAIAGSIASMFCFSRMLSLKKLWQGIHFLGERQQLLRFAVPIGGADLINELLKRIDIFLVARFLPTDILGIYGIAQEGAATIKKIRQAFNPIFIPVISAAHQQQDRTGMRHQYRNVTRWILILDAAFLIIMFMAGRQVMHLFGAEFVAGAAALAILSLAQAINGTLGVAELFILIDKPWINLVNSSVAIIAGLGLNLFLIPRYGMMGAASAVLILFLVLNFTRLFQVSVLYKLHPFTRYHLKAVAAFVIALGTGWAFLIAAGAQGTSKDLIAVLLCWMIYFGLLWAFGPAPEEKKAANRWRERIFSRSSGNGDS